ncbi:hypothetical protein ACET3X_009009 [Alternaria dauci]|uniref:Uncharacterized protein n=1 Tax=Alternaria dauci TaxID=48095 RepID=A0ABR3U7K9_9PLEO
MSDKKPEEEQSADPRCTPNYDTSDSLQQEITRVLKDFKNDVLGITFLGNDGVLRSLTADRKVLSAQGLRPELIQAFLSRFPEEYRAKMTNSVFADGTKTPKEKWYEPDPESLPAPLPQEKIEEVKNQSEERKNILRKRLQEDKNLLDVTGVLA